MSENLIYDVTEYPKGVHKTIVKSRATVLYQKSAENAVKIILPEQLTYYDQIALEELTEFLQKSTNHTFEIVKDTGLTFNETDKYISLGNNGWFQSSGLSVDFTALKSTGYRLVTKGNTVFVLGSSHGFGIVNGVYGLLKYLIGYKCYSTDCILYDQKDEITLNELDVTEIPAIETVVRSNIAYSSIKDLLRMHLIEWAAEFGIPKFGHTALDWITKQQAEEHPDWFTVGEPRQPCLTNKDLANQYVENIFRELQEDKRARVVFLGQTDGPNECRCERCKAELDLYGPQYSALLIRFMNYVSEKVDEKLKEAGDGRNIQYATYAYLHTEEPPVKTTEDGKYVANHESVIPNSNLAVQYAPIYAQYNASFKDEVNAATKEKIEKWSAISNIMWSYTYGVNYHDYFVGLNNFGALQGMIGLLAETGTSCAFVQAKFHGTGYETAQFTPLRQFLISELCWNPYGDVNALVKEFMTAYYGSAADAIYEYYQTYRAHYAYLEREHGVTGNIFYDFSAEHWDCEYVLKVKEHIDSAFKAIEPLKETDGEAWKIYADRITLESLHYRYLLLRYHKNLYEKEIVLEMIDGFEKDCRLFGIEQYKEVAYITDLISEWKKELLKGIIMRKNIAIIGYGARGRIYKAFADRHPDLFHLVAVVEIDAKKREFLKQNGVPHVYEDYRDFLKEKHALDMVIVSTNDADHREQAVACLNQGYHLLLEKPIATTMEDCERVLEAAKRNNRKVFVAHVLRYTPFYSKLKDIIDSGKLGEVLSIHASENIGFYHFAHSYVRGNWHKKEDSSPIILAKCCHDMDIIAYLMNETCESISSVGELKYFNEEHAPEHSTQYCSDCPLGKECIYNAARIYTSDYGRAFAGYFMTKDGSDEEILKALPKCDYDRCVYHNDNDVVDHQSTVMKFKNGKTAVHTMVAFSKEIYRDIKIYGTKAELVGTMEENFIEIRTFGGDVERVPLVIENDIVGGHCGGDNYFMHQIYHALNDEPCKGITYLDVSVHSHKMAFAAEESRVKGGVFIPING